MTSTVPTTPREPGNGRARPAGTIAIGGAPPASLVLLGLVLALLAGGGTGAASSGEEPAPASGARVVSLSARATAFVVDLGAASSLIAVDRESAALLPEHVGSLPVVELGDVPALGPALVLVGSAHREDAETRRRLREAGAEVVTVAPRGFEDVFALCRGLGARLVGTARAADFELTLGKQLARLAGASRGRSRPRVAAVLAVEPFELAPAHGFATDLIELAGGTSTTHDHEAVAMPSTAAQLAAAAPDLILVWSSAPPSEAGRARARRALGEAAPIEFFVLDAERFWVRESLAAVARLQALIEPLSH